MDIKKTYPVREAEYEIENNITVISYFKKPSFVERVVFKWLKPKPYKVDLDEVGSFIWQLCDGKNTVENIIEKAKVEFADKINPAEERVKLFLSQLNQNKFITLYKKIEE